MDSDSSQLNQSEEIFQPFSFSKRLVLLLIVQTGIISLIAVVSLLALVLWNHARRRQRFKFLRRPVDYFFFGLLVADLFRAIGHMMGIAWVAKAGIKSSTSCSIEGAFRHIGSVGEALFTLSIAVYTFLVIYLRLNIPSIRCLPWVVVGSIILFLTLMVAVCVSAHKDPPFYGPAGLWCWVADKYKGEKIGAAIWHLLARNGRSTESNQQRRETMSIAKKMLVYPVAYIILILPVSIIRFIGFYDPNADVEAVWRAIAGVIYAASGLVNALLYIITRPRLLPSFRIGIDDDHDVSDTATFASGGVVEAKALDTKSEQGSRTRRHYGLDDDESAVAQ
ncbi:hypothetical protein FRC02_001644 [Tulasnella sp. 418]|nr:hypothetical protein FRC02_001644 [Tulasnella sp. 418]